MLRQLGGVSRMLHRERQVGIINRSHHRHNQLLRSCAVVTSYSPTLRSNTLLHLGDVKPDVTLHLHVLFPCTLDFMVNILLEISHLQNILLAKYRQQPLLSIRHTLFSVCSILTLLFSTSSPLAFRSAVSSRCTALRVSIFC